MTRKPRSPAPVRQHDPEKPPLPAKPVPPGAAKESPQPRGVEVHAQKLLHEAGSTELAKSAVDSAAQREAIPCFREDMLAQKWGFSSRKDMLDASKPLTDGKGIGWWATAVQGGRWIVWNEHDMSVTKSFVSLEAAQADLIRRGGEIRAVLNENAGGSRVGTFPEVFNG